MKICSKCVIEKPLTEFHSKRNKPQAQCKKCRAEYMASHYQNNKEIETKKRKEWYAANKSKVLARMKAERAMKAPDINLKRRLKKYGLTKEQFETMMATQNYLCANRSCQSGMKDLDIDHCHVTGAVRGILCSHCNTALGLVKESTEALMGLIDYLYKYKK